MTKVKNEITAEQVAEYLDYGTEEEGIAAAYLALKITSSESAEEIAKEITDSYNGKFSSDEEFAMDMAEETGARPETGSGTGWPLYCIDWEYAARDLMMDYSEQDGFYFRNV